MNLSNALFGWDKRETGDIPIQEEIRTGSQRRKGGG